MTDQLCHEQTGTGNASVIQVESSKLMPLIVLLALLAGLAIALACVAAQNATKAERESRMLEYYVNILNQTLVEQGLRKPEDNYLKFKQEQTKE